MTRPASWRAGAGIALLIAVSACSQQSGAPPAHPMDQSCVFQSAEAYENLTEKAYPTDAPALAAMAADAEMQARACIRNLSASDADALSMRLDAVRSALDSDDRAAIARSAVEAYRIFVTAERREAGGVPLQVSLLDYAGFRMQADLQEVEPNWADMEQALAFADQQWSEIEGTISDAALRASFSAALDRIRTAAEGRNAPAAMEAVVAELDQVDLLEQHFAR